MINILETNVALKIFLPFCYNMIGRGDFFFFFKDSLEVWQYKKKVDFFPALSISRQNSLLLVCKLLFKKKSLQVFQAQAVW